MFVERASCLASYPRRQKSSWGDGNQCFSIVLIRCKTPEASAALAAYSWPGNVRELRNVIERAVVLSRGDRITVNDLPDRILAAPQTPAARNFTLEELERRHIQFVLEQAMTLEEAAEMLGINVATLWRKRRRYGMD